MSDPNRARELLAEELKPCPIPWCGGLAEMRRGYPDMRERFIICNKCGLKSPHSKPFDEAGIAALWNASALNGERDAIVRWMREKALQADRDSVKAGTREANRLADISGMFRQVADAISRGAHLRIDDRGDGD
jgi:hypothetical protein